MNKIVKIPSVVLLICLTGLPQIGETIYSRALPDIAKSLHASNDLVQWTLSIFLLGFARWKTQQNHLGILEH